MQPLIDLYKNSEQLHHAYFLVAHKVQEEVAKLKYFLEEHVGVKTVGNPDVTHHQFKTLTIDDARALAESSARKSFESFENNSPRVPLGEGKKIFIIEVDFITEEAQNSLLKVFEEPTLGTHFFIISPQDILLPTLRSRMQVINMSRTPLDMLMSRGVLDMGVGERLAVVKEIVDAISDEEKTKQDAISLLNRIEKELYERGVEKVSDQLKICEQARRSLYDRGAPIKMILEHLMLSM